MRKKTAEQLFSLREKKYEDAVRAMYQHAEVEGEHGWNPLGGESDDIDVGCMYDGRWREKPSVGGLRVFLRNDGAVDIVGRAPYHPWAHRVIYPALRYK